MLEFPFLCNIVYDLSFYYWFPPTIPLCTIVHLTGTFSVDNMYRWIWHWTLWPPWIVWVCHFHSWHLSVFSFLLLLHSFFVPLLSLHQLFSVFAFLNSNITLFAWYMKCAALTGTCSIWSTVSFIPLGTFISWALFLIVLSCLCFLAGYWTSLSIFLSMFWYCCFMSIDLSISSLISSKDW